MMTTRSDLATVAMHIRLAARAAGVRTVRLMSVGRPCDLEPVAGRLTALFAPAGDDALPILPLHSDSYSRQTESANTGLIVVTPSRLRRRDVEDVSNLLSISGWRFLGILPYRSPGILDRIASMARRSARTATPVTGVPPTFAAAAADEAAFEPNGNGQDRVAALAWRLEHPQHKQRG